MAHADTGRPLVDVTANARWCWWAICVVEVGEQSDEARTADLNALVNGRSSKSARTGRCRRLVEHLPREEMSWNARTLRSRPQALNQFFPVGADDWLGFSQGAEAEVAQYQLGGQEVTLLLADFPTPQIGARQAFAASSEKFNVNRIEDGRRAHPPVRGTHGHDAGVIFPEPHRKTEADALLDGSIRSEANLE